MTITTGADTTPATTPDHPADGIGAGAPETTGGREATGAAEATSGLETTPVWVESWPGPDDEAAVTRHHLRSDYVETFWLPVLGPSSILLLRLLAAGLARSPGGYALDLGEAARMLGIGHRGGRNGPMSRTLERCCAFGATRIDHGHQLLVRQTLATLGPRQVARLPRTLQQRHPDAVRQAALRPPPAPVEAMRTRCRTLALSLLELGEDTDAAERQLHRWRFHPALAHESVVWARQRLADALPGRTPSN